MINSSLSNSEFNAVPHKVRDGGVRLYNLLYSRLAPDVVKRLNRDIVDVIVDSKSTVQRFYLDFTRTISNSV